MTEPTDAELWQLYMQQPGQHKDPIDFVRAVLAKLGQPSGAGEVDRADAVNLARNCLGAYNCAITKKGICVLAEAVLSMDAALSTPQPTQAQAGAVPLTDEQCDAIYEALDSFGREVDHYEFGLPYCTSDGETLAKTEAREVIRQAVHGIKGGQHGADT